MSKPPPSMPSGSGPQGSISDEMIAEHYIANYAERDPLKAVVLLIRSNRSLTSELRSLKAAGLAGDVGGDVVRKLAVAEFVDVFHPRLVSSSSVSLSFSAPSSANSASVRSASSVSSFCNA